MYTGLHKIPQKLKSARRDEPHLEGSDRLACIAHRHEGNIWLSPHLSVWVCFPVQGLEWIVKCEPPGRERGKSQHILGEKSEPLHCSLEAVKNWKTEKISTKNKETAATVEILLCVRLPITRYNILVLTLMSTISDIKLITCLWALTCCIVGLLGAVTLWAADGQGRWFSCEVIWTEEC